MSNVRTSIARLLAALLLASGLAPVLAQAPMSPTAPRGIREDRVELVLQAYTFKHRSANEALSLVYPLLSQRGAVELQPASNTLVIRDSRAAVSRILPVLLSFDHPARPLRLEILVVKASRTPVSPPIRHSDLPEALTQRLEKLFNYDIFELAAKAHLTAQEGQAVSYNLGQDYAVSFRFGSMTPEGRVKLSNFRLTRLRGGAGDPAVKSSLLHSNLNLWLGKTMSLAVAPDEASREAVMVVLTPRRGDARPAPRQE